MIRNIAVLSGIDQKLLSRAALRCHAYARAVMLYESALKAPQLERAPQTSVRQVGTFVSLRSALGQLGGKMLSS